MKETIELSEFGIILLFFIGGLIFLAGGLLFSRLISPNKPNIEKLKPYECGEEPTGEAWGRFNLRFYIVALIFILFDVELVFLFPWATVFGREDLIQQTAGLWGWFSLTEMLIFIGILILGLAYVWVNGFLDWIKPQQEESDFKPVVPTALYEKLNEKQYTIEKQAKA